MAGDTIFVTDSITVIDFAGECADTVSFVVSITDGPILDPIADVAACDFYVLDSITGTNLTGNEAYYSQFGDTLMSGDTIFVTDSITVIDFAGECADTVSFVVSITCLLYTSPSPRDRTRSRMPSSA